MGRTVAREVSSAIDHLDAAEHTSNTREKVGDCDGNGNGQNGQNSSKSAEETSSRVFGAIGGRVVA